MSDVEIAQNAAMKPIIELAFEKLGIEPKQLDPYGHYKAKISLDYLQGLEDKKSEMILVTAMSPTPAGEGKTTTVVGLGDALNRLNKKTIICLREPSLGPCFGLKGGAAGGGYAQVVPMEDINLHFTGDFHAISIAHNLLAAMIDNHLHHGNALQIDIKTITWKRVVDMNDRSLREIAIGQGSKVNGVERNSGFDIVAASEVMAILCLATSLDDLKARLARIIIGYTQTGRAVYAEDLKASGAMTAILKEAIKPNLVQTLENNLAIIHGGPFANIAHGCNSVIATKAALKLADYAIVEAGFGADLGAEKFLDIKCRSADLTPSAVVLVVTIRAIKYHGDVVLENLNTENLNAVEKGFANVAKHIENIKQKFGLDMLVCINHFKGDTEDELTLVSEMCSKLGVKSVVSKHWLKGGEGAEDLALEVLDLIKEPLKKDFFLYENEDLIEDKIKAIANEIYGASSVTYSEKAIAKLKTLQLSACKLPICIAKTPASFSTDPNLKGAPINHCLEVSDLILNNGAGFIIVKAGNIMTMPGLPKNPIAEKIDISAKNLITGLM